MNRQIIARLVGAGVLAAMGLALVSATGPNAVASAQSGDGPVKRYIVVLNEPSLAQYQGGIKGLAPTSVDALRRLDPARRGDVHLDLASPAARAYTSFLLRRQDTMIDAVQSIAPEFDQRDWQFQRVLNGFVAQLTPGHAEDVRRMRGVRMVFPVEELKPEMDATKYLVGTMKAWEAAGGVAEAGAGARIGTLEAGNAVVHPFFNDQGMPPAPEGWPKARYMLRDGTTGTFTNTVRLVNNKVLGFTAISDTFTDADLEVINNGFAISGHGSHVLGTIGGRWGNYEIATNIKVDMAGIAPMAQLFTYPVYGTTAEMIKAFEVMVEDEIDAVNLSLGTTTWLLDSPDMHPVSVAMSGATEAGLVVVGSAGNAGSNGRTSLSAAWKYNEDVVTVGNTGTNGTMGPLVSVNDAGAPAALKDMPAGILGNPPHSAPITGALAFIEGGGCAANPAANGKIAVVERFDEQAVAVGSCTYAARAQLMKDSGATAIIYLYFDRPNAAGSATTIALPGVALAYRDSVALRDWLKAGNAATATLGSAVQRGYKGIPDYLEGSSSRGPGLNWSIKPDISAPGSSIISSVLGDDNTADDKPPSVATWPAYGGTSMSAPHITGAAGLLRSMHPNWTARQVKSALVTTAEPVIVSGYPAAPTAADPTQGGPGRLDLSDAHDPKSFLFPPKLSFGRTDPGQSVSLEVVAESASSQAVTWNISVEAKGGDATVKPSVTSLAVPAGEEATFDVSLDVPDTSQVNEHWGYVVLKEAGAPAETARTLRLAYYTFVDVPSLRKNVLIVNWTMGATQDFVKYYTDALDAMGLTYTVWGLGEAGEHPQGVAQTSHPPYNLMAQHDLVLVNTNMSPRSFHEYTGITGMFQYQNLPLGGGNLLIAGQGAPGWWRYLNRNTRYADSPANRAALPDTWPYSWGGPSQNVGCEMCMARYFAGFTPQLTATLSGRLLVPFPTKPDEPEMDVVLKPHTDADGPFDYSLDISTGAKAKDGAAGNQYRFASGAVADEYIATGRAQITKEHGDLGDAEGVMGRYSPLARPLWSYAVTDTVRVVGTYIAGQQQPEAEVPWNAMFWGFGLEGVGQGGEGTVDRKRLMGDTFNFLAHNLYATAKQAGATPADGQATVQVDIPETADQALIAGVEIDWGDGKTDTRSFEATAMPRTQIHLHPYEKDGTYTVRIKYLPATGAGAAPIYAHTTVTVKLAPKGMYLPALLKGASFGQGNAPMAAPRRDD